jgi:hypothetical protein
MGNATAAGAEAPGSVREAPETGGGETPSLEIHPPHDWDIPFRGNRIKRYLNPVLPSYGGTLLRRGLSSRERWWDSQKKGGSPSSRNSFDPLCQPLC